MIVQPQENPRSRKGMLRKAVHASLPSLQSQPLEAKSKLWPNKEIRIFSLGFFFLFFKRIMPNKAFES
jgi:hypothetical protein